MTQLGSEAFRNKDFKSAFNHFSELCKSREQNKEQQDRLLAHIERKRELARLKREADAKRAAEKALKPAGNDEEEEEPVRNEVENGTAFMTNDEAEYSMQIYSMQSAAALQIGKYDEAIAAAQTCIDIAPEWSIGYSRLGFALMRKGEAKLAKAAFESGLIIDPTDAALQQGLAKVSAREGELEPVIGVDFGTSKIAAGVWWNGQHIITDANGNSTIPASVAWNSAGQCIVGAESVQQAEGNAERTFYEIKKLIGLKMTDPRAREIVESLPYVVTSDANDNPIFTVDGRQMTSEEVAAALISYIKVLAEKTIDMPINKAVISTPSSFSDAQRQAIRASGEIAGLQVLRIINETTAAALGRHNIESKEASNSMICLG